MSKALMPRPLVHLWSEAIGENPNDHQSALQRLLRDQRRLTKFVEENAEQMDRTTAGVAVYFLGVVVRMFDLAGGRLKSVTWEQVRAAEQRISEAVPQLLPYDAAFFDRVRAISWRAQPHVLDEAMMALFQSARTEQEMEVARTESMKIFFLVWVAVEALDANWLPAKDFAGESTYEYHHIEPRIADSTDAGAEGASADAG